MPAQPVISTNARLGSSRHEPSIRFGEEEISSRRATLAPPRVDSASLWNIDLTVAPIRAGFSVPWCPFSLPQCWPFAWWVFAIVDHFSRVVVGFAVFEKQPTAAEISAALDRAVGGVGKAPWYIVSDQGPQFQEAYRATCLRHGIRPRYGAIGNHGSIARIERFFRTLKSELLRRIVVPLNLAGIRGELKRYLVWYNTMRPHRALGGATPMEVYEAKRGAHLAARFEPRARYPAGAPCAVPRARVRGKPGVRLELRVHGFDGGDCHVVPVLELKRAA